MSDFAVFASAKLIYGLSLALSVLKDFMLCYGLHYNKSSEQR